MPPRAESAREVTQGRTPPATRSLDLTEARDFDLRRTPHGFSSKGTLWIPAPAMRQQLAELTAANELDVLEYAALEPPVREALKVMLANLTGSGC